MPSLALSYTDFKYEVASFLGYNSASLTAAQQTQVDSIISSGLRQFYYPPSGHEWSFLKPTVSFTADDADYDLPSGFARIVGGFTFPGGENYAPVKIVSEAEIRRLRQTSESTGRPQYAAIRPKAASGTAIQRFEALFWPGPDQDYTFSYSYVAIPTAISVSEPYPYGGMPHSETILESILSVAETRANDTSGLHMQRFLQLLSSSQALDQRTGPDSYGYMTETSLSDYEPARATRGGCIVTVNLTGTSGSGMTDEEVTALSLAFGGGNGVIRTTGSPYLKVTAQGTPSMMVDVAIGYAWIDNTLFYLNASETTDAFVAPVTHPRIDIVQATLTSDIVVKTGVEAAVPAAPSVDDDSLVLATIYCRVGMTSIKNTDDTTNGYITDARAFL